MQKHNTQILFNILNDQISGMKLINGQIKVLRFTLYYDPYIKYLANYIFWENIWTFCYFLYVIFHFSFYAAKTQTLSDTNAQFMSWQ